MTLENPFADTDPKKVDEELSLSRMYLPPDGRFKVAITSATLYQSSDPNKPGVYYFNMTGKLVEGTSGFEGAEYSMSVELPRADRPQWRNDKSKTQILQLFCAAFGRSPDSAENREKAVVGMQKLGAKLYDNLAETLVDSIVVITTKGRPIKKGERAGEVYSELVKFEPDI